MKKKQAHLISFIIILIILLAACKPLPRTATPLPGDAAVATSAVSTFIAQLTSSAGQTAVTQLTQIVQIKPVVTTTPPELIIATLSPIPPTPTPIPPTSTSVPVACDWVELIASITVPDGTLFQPGTPFTKTWRLKNIGSCTWTPDYALVFFNGDKLNGPDSVALSGDVLPGQTVDLSVNLLADNTPGTYTGYWELRNASGVFFGTGSNAEEPIWVNIKVGKQLQIAYEFVSIVCAAEWSSDSLANLPCPGLGYDSVNGFVMVQPHPVLEDGVAATNPAIITYPSQGTGGMISGRYPPFLVKDGDHFRTAIGCLYESLNCNVVFMLNFSSNNGPIQNLGTWTVSYNKHFQSLDIDLSPLAGQSVEFILTVLNNGNSTDDWAFWLMPAIYR
jgi:hypothetical protein